MNSLPFADRPAGLATSGAVLVDAASRQRLSDTDLVDAIASTASRLSSGRKLLVAVLGTHQLSTVLAFLASFEAGHAVVWVDVGRRQSLDAIVSNYQPDLVVLGNGSESTRPIPDGYHLDSDQALGVLWRLARAAGTAPLHPDLACVLSTSGTTGSRKVVRLSRANLIANAQAIVEALGLGPNHAAITMLPIAHAFGLSVITSHLASGGTIVVSGARLLEANFWRAVREEAVTCLYGVPFTYEVLRQLNLDALIPSSVSLMTQAGGRLGVDHVRFFRDFMAARGGSFRVMYGQTEATARIAVWPHSVAPEKLASAGRVISGGGVRIDPVSDEILYRGPNVMMGYAEGREDLARPHDVEELRTGDLGRLDADGFLFVTGRIKRIAKLAGHRVNLDEVEALFDGKRVAAIERDGHLTLFVERLAEGDRAALARQLTTALGLDASLVSIREIDHLPRTAAGKVDYVAVGNLL